MEEEGIPEGMFEGIEEEGFEVLGIALVGLEVEGLLDDGLVVVGWSICQIFIVTKGFYIIQNSSKKIIEGLRVILFTIMMYVYMFWYLSVPYQYMYIFLICVFYNTCSCRGRRRTGRRHSRTWLWSGVCSGHAGRSMRRRSPTILYTTNKKK